jgi:hypothetical protein
MDRLFNKWIVVVLVLSILGLLLDKVRLSVFFVLGILLFQLECVQCATMQDCSLQLASHIQSIFVCPQPNRPAPSCEDLKIRRHYHWTFTKNPTTLRY